MVLDTWFGLESRRLASVLDSELLEANKLRGNTIIQGPLVGHAVLFPSKPVWQLPESQNSVEGAPRPRIKDLFPLTCYSATCKKVKRNTPAPKQRRMNGAACAFAKRAAAYSESCASLEPCGCRTERSSRLLVAALAPCEDHIPDPGAGILLPLQALT